MKIALYLAALLGALIVIVLIVGALLPPKHQISRELILRAAPPEIYVVLRDFTTATSWRRNLQRVETLEPVDGRVRFREYSNGGAVTYELVEEVPNEKMITRIVDRDLGYSGSWTYELFATNEGTRLRITENGEVSNILFRFMSRFIFGHASTLDGYLASLRAKFGPLR